VEDHHVSYQSWHRGTQRLKKRSSNGISVRITPAQEETKRSKRHVCDKSRHYSDDSEYSRERRGDPKHNRGTTAQSREEMYSRNTTPQLEKEEEDFVQETPEAALIAAQAYLLTTHPEPGDPREEMHQGTIRSLGIVEGKIMGKVPEAKSTSYKEGRKKEFKHKITQNESSESSEEER
jgi:hypothetical protein